VKVHIAACRVCTEIIETACGVTLCEKDGLHAWPHGGTEFWGVDLEEVDCERCLRARTRERYFTSIRRSDLH
jgi:hypothetical protein